VAADQGEYPGRKGDGVAGRQAGAVVWVGAAGGVVRRGPVLPAGVGAPPVRLAGELGELVHDGHLLSCPVVRVVVLPLSPPAAAGDHAER
jgi:hypothetical protein